MFWAKVFGFVWFVLLLTSNCCSLCRLATEAPQERLNFSVQASPDTDYSEHTRIYFYYNEGYCQYCSLCPFIYYAEGGVVYEMHPKYYVDMVDYYRSVIRVHTCRPNCLSLPGYLLLDQNKFEMVGPTHKSFLDLFKLYGDPLNKGETLSIFDPHSPRKVFSLEEIRLDEVNETHKENEPKGSEKDETEGSEKDETEGSEKDEIDYEDIILAVICVFAFFMVILGTKIIIDKQKKLSVQENNGNN